MTAVKSETSMHASTKETKRVWAPEEKSFSANSVIDAYLKGREHGIELGKNENSRILLDKFEANLTEAGKATEELLNYLKQAGYSVEDIRLNPEEVTTFSVLVFVAEKDYISEGFISVYSKARDIKNKYSSTTFYISFSFMPYSKKLNEACLLADGYSWKYAKIQGKTGSRTA